MGSLQVVMLLCFLNAIAGRRFQTIHNTAQIDNMNRIGSFVTIDANVKIFGNSLVGGFSTIGSGAQIGPYGQIGAYSNIGPDVLIANGSIIGNYCNFNRRVSAVNNVRVSNYVNIGSNTILHDNCEIQSYANIGSDAEIWANVFVNSYSSIADKVSVGAGSVLDKYSSVDYASRIGSNVCIGNYGRVGRNAVIEDNAVVLKYASVRDGERVFKDEVIILTPSSAYLYSSCLPLHHIQQSQVDNILNGADTNNILLDLMKQQFDQLTSNCPSSDFSLLQLIKSLYLIKYHGRESYETNCQQLSSGFTSRTFSGNFNNVLIGSHGIFINGERVTNDGSKPMLSQEFHFGSNDISKILNAEAKDQMIRLLAIEHDSRRNVRVQGDSYCKMLGDIKSKQRTVKCDT